MSQEIKKKLLVVSFCMSLLYALFYAMPLYINSTMLGAYFDKTNISVIYTLAAVATFLFSLTLSKYIKKLHNYKLTLIILLIGFLSTFSIGFFENKYLIASAFALHFLAGTIIFTLLNIFIEEFTAKSEEGSVRGVFLTVMNAGILISPIVSGQLLAMHGYKIVYIVSALMLIPIAFLIRHYYAHIPDPIYRNINIKNTFKQILKDKNISGVMLAHFMLNSFFTMMAIYAPLYLFQMSGITITQYVSVIMPFALIPFVLLPYELGYLADKKFGEKEMLLIGFSLIIICALLFPFLNTSNLFYIALFLFVSRIGAAMLETMNHTYFYKKIEVEKVSIITIFNNMQTLAYIITPALAALVLALTGDMRYIFITYALLACITVYKIAKIKDTK